MTTLHSICSQFVRDNQPVVHEVFCIGQCEKPQRELFGSGEEYFEAMGKYLKGRAK